MRICYMRKRRSTFFIFSIPLLILLVFALSAAAQENNNYAIQFKSGVFTPDKNIIPARISFFNSQPKTTDSKNFLVIQFDAIPSEAEKQALKKEGITLLQYIPAKSYVCEIALPLSADVLKNHNARAIIVPGASQKTDPFLINRLDKNGEEEVLVAFYSSVNYDNSIDQLRTHGFAILSSEFKGYNLVKLRITLSRLEELAAFPFIQYIEKAPPLPTPLNLTSRNNARANLLQTNLPGGYNLTGEGVIVGVSEITGSPQPHIDFADRLLAGSSLGGYHSTHVNGTLGGAGLVNELYKGYAPKVGLYSTVIIGSMAPLVNQTNGMVLTTNSYATGGPCANYGASALQTLYDQQAIGFPSLQAVFAGGNSGLMPCSRYPVGFNTIEGAQTSGKSTIAVGNILADGQLNTESSKGPTSDGRIKPDVVATGTNIISTTPGNSYGANTGTSMASPAVAGGLALMYQRYKQLHNEQNPPSALMKAILCNTAVDAGNAGPDFSYGFGMMNVYRAIKAIDGNQYFLDSVTNASTKTRSISVESAAQLKIVLYWQDPAASLMSSNLLVNDLDLTVTGPSGIIHMPYRLDTNAVNVANPATRGEDHVNNIEQVVIDFPQAGNYSINVKGTEVGQNPQQQYYVTYDLLPNDIMLTFPFGNEALVPGENITVQWDSWGADNSTFSLELSADNGATWQIINGVIPADKRQLDWQVPNTITTNALLRITRNADHKTNTSGKFTIIGTPVISLSADQCPGYISLQWNVVTGADHYEIMRVSNGEMISVDTTSTTSYTITNLSIDSLYWVTVRSVINSKPGRRAIALSRQPVDGNCTGVFYNNNLKADTLVAPLTGRKFTSTQLSAAQHIVVRIKNLDDQPANSFSVSYSVNGSSWISENVNTAIAAGATLIYSSNAVYDFSQPGQYTVQVAVKNNTPDPDTKNDTLKYVVRYFDNLPVNLATPFIEKFEQSGNNTYNNSFPGLTGIDRFDYNRNSGLTRILFPLNELSDTSGRSLKFDLPYPTGSNYSDNAIIGTYNLSSYDTATNDIGLNFTYGAMPVPRCFTCIDNSQLFIRGNDTQPWIPVLFFTTVGGNSFTNKKIEGIELTDILTAAGQNFSSSFQLKLSHSSAGYRYLFDDITLYDASNDIALASIDSINLKSCNLGIQPIRVTIRNVSKKAASNVQVHYKINNGATVTETISSVPANSSLPYTFSTTANLTTNGFYTIEAWVSLTNDPYAGNNLKKLTFRNQPLVSSFPYIENFENSDGSFYTDGVNSSWKYGKPSATLINKAASGDAAWKTSLDGKYNNDELSYLYSPCLDYSSLQNPVVSMSLAMNIDSCVTAILYCDHLRSQYSTDGKTWTFFSFPGFRYNWANLLTGRNYYRWHVATQYLPTNPGRIQFRFLFTSNQLINYEGAAIDDFHVYDMKSPIYDTTLSGIPLSQSITAGNNWIEFLQEQKIVAAINPYGQNLGNTVVKSYVRPATPISNFHGQYFLNRTFNIITENKNLVDSIGIRLYYLDSEADSLLFAANCIKCSKPADAYRFGISQYTTDSLTEENDNIPDNINGQWSFIQNKNIKIVPYGKGYYAEFKVKDLSEFRLNSGGPDKQSYLPANLLSFSAIKTANNVTDLAWKVASEINISRYEIEIAKGNDAYSNNQFVLLGQVTSPGPTTQNRSYSFPDATVNKSGVIYYRLKVIDEFGNYSYSKVIPVLYSKELSWKVFPNPSSGYFTLRYQLSNGERGTMNIYNSLGQLVKSQTVTGDGYVQTMGIDMASLPYQKGMYLVKVFTDNYNETFKLLLE